MLRLGIRGSVYDLAKEGQISREIARTLEAQEARGFMRKLQEKDKTARAEAQEKERLRQIEEQEKEKLRQLQEKERIKQKKQALIIALHSLDCEIDIKTLNEGQTFITGALKEKGE